MSFPSVNIPRQNGQLKRVQPSEDAVVCFLLSGVAVVNGVQLGTPYQVFGSSALDTYKITADTNALALAEITDFYDKAGEGAELNFMLVNSATTLADICNKNLQIGKKLLDSVTGRGVIFIVNKTLPNGYNQVITNGLDSDVWAAVANVNAMAKQYDDANTPFVAVLPGIGASKATLANLSNRNTLTYDYTAISLACKTNNQIVSMGMLAGIIANRQVHRNIARVADGAVSDGGFLPDGTSVIDPDNIDVMPNVHDKGYIVLRKIGDYAGYYFSDDPTLTASSGDFTSISWNRVINKAKRIAFKRIILKLNDDVDTNPDTGKIETGVASDWESDIESAIKAEMMRTTPTKVKEIDGVKCTVDVNSDIANDQVDLSLQIVRKGQAKIINVSISYARTI